MCNIAHKVSNVDLRPGRVPQEGNPIAGDCSARPAFPDNERRSIRAEDGPLARPMLDENRFRSPLWPDAPGPDDEEHGLLLIPSEDSIGHNDGSRALAADWSTVGPEPFEPSQEDQEDYRKWSERLRTMEATLQADRLETIVTS